MHHCSKHHHSENESREDGETDSESKDCEHLKVSEEQPETTSKCGYTSTEDTDSHFSVSLSHFVISCLTCWMHVISTQMENIINSKTDKHHKRDWLRDTELLTVPDHEGHDAQNNDCHVENWDKGGDWISGNNHQYNEWETHSHSNTLESTLKESLLEWNLIPTNRTLKSPFHFWAICFGIFIQLCDPILP